MSEQAVQPLRRPARPRRAELVSTPEGLVASVTGGAATDVEFAYYLLRGGDRVDTVMYSPRTQVWFPHPTVEGDYQVQVFERRGASGPTGRFRSGHLQQPERCHYDLTPWGASVVTRQADQALEPVDGIQRFVTGGASSLDFLLEGFSDPMSGQPVLVCFSAAVPKRREKAAPFFSGRSLAKACGLPLVAVADPTLGASTDVALGWYGGSATWPRLHDTIAQRLDELAAACRVPLILVGGSGGGFAALATLNALHCQASAIVWNPQTSISAYSPRLVSRYLLAAFPETARKFGLDRPAMLRTRPERLLQCLEQTGIRHDLAGTTPTARKPILYLQNAGDRHHVERHLRPLMNAWRVDMPVGRPVAASPEGVTACLAEWGSGHVPPSAAAVASFVRGVAQGQPMPDLAQAFVASLLPSSTGRSSLDARDSLDRRLLRASSDDS